MEEEDDKFLDDYRKTCKAHYQDQMKPFDLFGGMDGLAKNQIDLELSVQSQEAVLNRLVL